MPDQPHIENLRPRYEIDARLAASAIRKCFLCTGIVLDWPLPQAECLEGRIDVFEMNVERTKPIDIRC